MTVEDILAAGKIYTAATSRTHNELICMVAVCEHCGADVDEYCMGVSGRRRSGVVHCARRTAAERWRKKNRAEWETLKGQVLRHMIQMELEK